MLLRCFRDADPSDLIDGLPESPRAPRKRSSQGSVKRSVQLVRRHGSADSRASTASSSNESISRLAPCPGLCDAKVESMMMPVPPEPRPSRCLRLSQPKTYSAIIDSMKQERGCRDWRNFAVFPPDDVIFDTSADDVARKRAADYDRKMRKYNSHSSADSMGVDMIG